MECFGVPFHAWTKENIKKIGEQWETVVCCYDQTSQNSSFKSTKILPDTCCYPHIQGSVCLTDVYVKEVEILKVDHDIGGRVLQTTVLEDENQLLANKGRAEESQSLMMPTNH